MEASIGACRHLERSQPAKEGWVRAEMARLGLADDAVSVDPGPDSSAVAGLPTLESLGVRSDFDGTVVLHAWLGKEPDPSPGILASEHGLPGVGG